MTSIALRIVVMGAYGLLGATLCPFLASKGYVVFRQGRDGRAEYQIDPTSAEDVKRLLEEKSPNVVVNLVAMTDVDACEKNPQAAYLANVRSVDVLVQALTDKPTHLVHISSDQVYDGPGPHTEAEAAPCNVYGLTKYAGELIADRVGATIFRTNFVGRSRAPDRASFTDWLVQSFRERRVITLFEDVRFSAMHDSILCEFIEHAVRMRPSGIYNVGCRDCLSKAAFGISLAERLGLDTSQVIIGPIADAKLLARRPLDMSLGVQRFERAFGVFAPTMNETLQRVTVDYLEDATDAKS